MAVLERERSNPINLFGEIHGIGPKKAEELVKAGITTIEELEKNQDRLNDTQKVGLKYYKEIKERIPREEINEFRSIFSKIFTDNWEIYIIQKPVV